MLCQDCGQFQDSSKTLVLGVTVYRCRSCRRFHIEGSDVSVEGGDGAMDRLRSIANDILSERRHKEMIESDITDPRWETWTQ